jgi:hypothetical protein
VGPIEVVIVGFPDVGRVAGIGPLLEDLVQTGHLGILDAILVTEGANGKLVITDLDDAVVPAWSTISPRPQPLLSAEDAALVAEEIRGGGAVVLVVVEHAWAESFSRGAADSGGVVHLHARIDPETADVAARVDA